MRQDSKVKLSKRMSAVAEFVKGENVVDIGCDHAFVSIYLKQKNMVNNVIAADVKKGPLEIANRNIRQAGLENSIQTRLSNGFESIKPGEVDCAIIAGMGGLLIVDILKKGFEHTKKGINLVLQPQSEIRKLREYIQDIGYYISQEKMLVEEGKFYVIMRAQPDILKKARPMSECELWFGPCLLFEKDETLFEYLRIKRRKNMELIKKLTDNNTVGAVRRLRELEKENSLFDDALKVFDE